MKKLTIIGCFIAALSFLTHSVQAESINVAGYPTREHGRALLARMEQGLTNGAAVGAGQFIVEDDAEFLNHLLNGSSIESRLKDYWDSEGELICGITGERQVLVSLDDGFGTPTDYSRKVMIASGLEEPMHVYTGLDIVQNLIAHTLIKQAGHHLAVVYHGSDIQSDGRLLSHLRRQGAGMAFVDERHAKAPGFAVALTMDENDDANVPSVLDYDIGPIPPRFAYVYATHGSDSPTLARAKAICESFGARHLEAASVQDAMAQLAQMHKGMIGGGWQ